MDSPVYMQSSMLGVWGGDELESFQANGGTVERGHRWSDGIHGYPDLIAILITWGEARTGVRPGQDIDEVKA